jgi:RNA polymerase sigma-70 factor (ECF subfamily)
VYFHQSADDEALVRRCLDGDLAAFEALVERYQRVAFTVALRIVGEYEDARDATQNTFIKVFEKLSTYEPGHRFFSWMYRILMNECLNAARRRRPTDALDPDQAAAANPVEAVECAERRRDVKAALMTLPLPYREVIVLRHFAALSYDEMAAALGVPAKTVKSRLHTARRHLAQLLSAWAVQR